jgi:pimeloyl-ACP methyl ester carboxylesterase
MTSAAPLTPACPPPLIPGRCSPQTRLVSTTDGVQLVVTDQWPVEPVDHTVILLHGLCLTRRSWYRPARRLRRPGMRLIHYDHRGHGRSQSAPPSTYNPDQLAQDLAEVLTALQVSGPVTFAGHSMGGMAALSYMARPTAQRPVSPCGLVLIGTAAGGLAEHGLGRLLAAPGLQPLIDLLDHVPHALSERIMGALARPLCDIVTHDKNLSAAVTDAFHNTPACTALAFLRSLRTYDQRAVLPSISAATTVISGGEDTLTPPAHSQEMASAIPGATHLHLPGAGHMLLHKAANVVGDAILRTIARGRDAAHDSNSPAHNVIGAPA